MTFISNIFEKFFFDREMEAESPTRDIASEDIDAGHRAATPSALSQSSIGEDLAPDALAHRPTRPRHG